MSFTVRRVREEKKPSSLVKYGHLMLPLVRSLWALRGHVHHVHIEEETTEKRKKTLKRTIAVLVSILIALLLLIGTLKVLVRLKTLALGMASVAGAELPKDEHGFTNLLLLGEGDSDHSGIDLTDTVMVASLDPDGTKSAVLLSIPRDTYFLSTEKMGAGRINSLYRDYKGFLLAEGMEKQEASQESMKELAKEVGKALGLEMHGVVKVTFSGFTEAIDAIGGIDVEVPEDLVDTEYPGPNYSYETFSIAKGPQHLDGATALKYARSRHSTSDFSRSARQQQIIAAAGKKVKEAGLIRNASRLTELLSIVSKNVESTLDVRQLLGLAAMGKVLDTSRIVNVQLSDQNGLFGSGIGQGGFLYAPPRDQFEGAAVLLPVSIPEFPVTWKQVQALSKLIFLHRDVFMQSAKIIVLNAGAKEGSARVLGGELYRYEFDVVRTRNYSNPTPDFPESFIALNPVLSAGDNPDTARMKRAEDTASLLSTVLKIKTGSIPDAAAFGDDGADIAIVLGEDFQYTPIQSRL